MEYSGQEVRSGGKGFRAFLKRKDIEFSAKRYLQEALSAMALGLFASLLVGLIIQTIGQEWIALGSENPVADFLVKIGSEAMKYMGAAIGVAVARGLKAPNLVIFSSAITGMLGAELGGPAGSFLAVAIGAECGKAISKETKVDIILTPGLTLLAGGLGAVLIGPGIGKVMTGLGAVIMVATEWHPFVFGIIISTIVGLVLTAPISSAALCIMLGLSGLAAGAATAGCCAQMVGFAVISFKDNGVGGLLAQGIGTSMLQISNIIKNPWILLPPTLAGVVTGPMATVLFHMENNPMGAGMGTSGLVGQIGTFTQMGFTTSTLFTVLAVQLVLPALLALAFYLPLKKTGRIKEGDMKLSL